MNKKDLIESLYKIMCSATSTAGDSRVTNNDYFKRRVLGFKAEIEFENLIKKYQSIRFLEGGQFISKKLSGSATDKNYFIYTTISEDEPSGYLGVYKIISNWNEVQKLIYIKINEEEWKIEDFETKDSRDSDRKIDKILKPNFTFYLFNKNTLAFEKIEGGDFNIVLDSFSVSDRRPNLFHLRSRNQFDYFDEYETNVLKKIYATRYFLDVVMRKAQGRQIIDLDGFLSTKDTTILVEIKEKSPIMDSTDEQKWQYGWDSRRILWYLYLLDKIKIPVLYNVHQINNRNERFFIQWDSIFINEFLSGVSWSSSRGGGGGEDTLLAPYLFFHRLENILDKLSGNK